MAFWENFGETITAKSKEVADKAKNFTDIAGLKGQIVTQENVILRNYKEIGREYYAAHKNDEEFEFPTQMEAVKNAEGIIAELKKKIADLNGTKRCASCDSEVPEDSAFCPKCGAKMEDKTEEAYFDEEDSVDVVVTEIIEEDAQEDDSEVVVVEITE